MEPEKIKILCVCRWPLGGIRTYLKYNYYYLPRDKFQITVLAPESGETYHLKKDMEEIGIEVIDAKPLWGGHDALFLRTWQIARNGKFDIIHSQGFISAIDVSLVNWLMRRKHVMTTHGVLEPKYFVGPLAVLKIIMVGWLLSNVDVIVGVGDDIVRHIKEIFPRLERGKTKFAIIPHGIRTEIFAAVSTEDKDNFREISGIIKNRFIFGYFGRFMPEKGFGEIIDAIALLVHEYNLGDRFVLVSMGGGDYEREYKRKIESKKIADSFIFLKFDSNIAPILRSCDTVLMPSWWEAYGLLALEALASGVPLIASDCAGLREATRDTPTIKIPPKDIKALATAMIEAMQNGQLKNDFAKFRPVAIRRFDVRSRAEELSKIFTEISAK